jgi:hypothetical protein
MSESTGYRSLAPIGAEDNGASGTKSVPALLCSAKDCVHMHRHAMCVTTAITALTDQDLISTESMCTCTAHTSMASMRATYLLQLLQLHWRKLSQCVRAIIRFIRRRIHNGLSQGFGDGGAGLGRQNSLKDTAELIRFICWNARASFGTGVN